MIRYWDWQNQTRPFVCLANITAKHTFKNTDAASKLSDVWV